MKRIRITLWLVILPAIATLSFAAGAAAQTVVVWTGDPDIDIPEVQAAVDQGGDVVVKGHFSFDKSPTIPTAPAGNPPAMVLVSKAVAISGAREDHDDDGELTSIYAGTIPFYVEAPGAHVSIQGLGFIRPKKHAVLVYAVSGLVIASCKIEGTVPVDNGSAGISISTSFNPPTLMNPGKPENVPAPSSSSITSSMLLEERRSIIRWGVLMFSVGVPGAQVEVYIFGTTIRNTTDRSINLYQIDGRAHIERNVITTSVILGDANVVFGRGTDVIHVTGTGSYLVAGNSVHSRWAAATGIRVQGQAAEWPIIGAVVVDNDVNMDAPEGTVFDANSAGIDVRGNAQDNVILNNRIRGRARAALVVAINQPTMVATNNHFILNRLAHFEASFADVFVGLGVMNTLIVGQGTVDDQGVGTYVVPVADSGDDKDNH